MSEHMENDSGQSSTYRSQNLETFSEKICAYEKNK